MKFRIITAAFAALALPFSALGALHAQAPEYQNPEQVVHQIAAPANDAADLWGIAATDLPFDDAYRIGVLGNGMRFIIRPNATPAQQGMVYLWINAGSLGEDADQMGYAHFVEHMAFNGSTNVPEGEMIPLLEREGLAFGPDTNASTSFDRTIYQLNLPRNDEALLDTAMMLMRETASEILFEEEAVAREIGVIQAEMRVRDTYALRNQLDQLDFLYPASRLSQRWIGGTDETIAGANAPRLRDYYARFYRPDNAAIIVVGEFDADAVETVIRRHFADWQADPVEQPTGAGPVSADLQGQTDVFIDPALSEAINMTRHGPWIDRADTVASRQQRVLRQIGYSIINRRMQSLARTENPPFRAAGVNTSDVFHAARSTTLAVQAAEGEWQRGMAAAQDEYRRAMAFGFSAAEVAEQVANLRAAIEANAAGAETRHNRNFMTGALTLLADAQVPTTPASALARFGAFADQITPDAVMQALLDDVVALDNPLIRFTGRSEPDGGPEDRPAGGAEAIRASWDAGMAAQLAAREEQDLAEFAYTDFGPPGTVISDTVEPHLDIRTVRFANGLMLNLKPTELSEDRITVQLNIDGGEMLNTRDNPLASAMTTSLIVGGLGAHSLDELQTILAGAQVGLSVSDEDETFRFTATTVPRDFEMQLQLLAAGVSDPGYRPAGEEQYRRNVANWYARRNATPASALSTGIGAIISDGDPRFSLQQEQDYLSLDFANLRDNIADRLAHGAMELAIVGDFDPDQAIMLVSRTLGALPPREEAFQPYNDNRDRRFTDDRSARALSHQAQDNQALLQMSWPTRDDSDVREHLQLELLERLMRISLTDMLREELGQTYSPSASANQSRIYPAYGTFTISAAINTDDVAATRAAMLATLASLRADPVSEDLLLRARAPQIEAYENALKTNNGWMGLVDRAQTEPDRITRYLSGQELLESLTAADLHTAAIRYLNPDERLEIVVLPESEEPETE